MDEQYAEQETKALKHRNNNRSARSKVCPASPPHANRTKFTSATSPPPLTTFTHGMSTAGVPVQQEEGANTIKHENNINTIMDIVPNESDTSREHNRHYLGRPVISGSSFVPTEISVEGGGGGEGSVISGSGVVRGPLSSPLVIRPLTPPRDSSAPCRFLTPFHLMSSDTATNNNQRCTPPLVPKSHDPAPLPPKNKKYLAPMVLQGTRPLASMVNGSVDITQIRRYSNSSRSLEDFFGAGDNEEDSDHFADVDTGDTGGEVVVVEAPSTEEENNFNSNFGGGKEEEDPYHLWNKAHEQQQHAPSNICAAAVDEGPANNNTYENSVGKELNPHDNKVIINENQDFLFRNAIDYNPSSDSNNMSKFNHAVTSENDVSCPVQSHQLQHSSDTNNDHNLEVGMRVGEHVLIEDDDRDAKQLTLSRQDGHPETLTPKATKGGGMAIVTINEALSMNNRNNATVVSDDIASQMLGATPMVDHVNNQHVIVIDNDNHNENNGNDDSHSDSDDYDEDEAYDGFGMDGGLGGIFPTSTDERNQSYDSGGGGDLFQTSDNTTNDSNHIEDTITTPIICQSYDNEEKLIEPIGGHDEGNNNVHVGYGRARQRPSTRKRKRTGRLCLVTILIAIAIAAVVTLVCFPRKFGISPPFTSKDSDDSTPQTQTLSPTMSPELVYEADKTTAAPIDNVTEGLPTLTDVGNEGEDKIGSGPFDSPPPQTAQPTREPSLPLQSPALSSSPTMSSELVYEPDKTTAAPIDNITEGLSEASRDNIDPNLPLPSSNETIYKISAALYPDDAVSPLGKSGSPQQLALEWLVSNTHNTINTATTSVATVENNEISEEQLIQRYALAVFYYATNGPEHWQSKFHFLDSNKNECEWKDNLGMGIHCDSLHRRVEKLVLEGNCLSGSIPLEIGLLTGIKVLNLSGNRLNGHIPAEIGKLTELEELSIDNNKLSGPIPIVNWTNLKGLRIIDLSSNHLNGTISNDIGKLTELTKFDIGTNKLVDTIPNEIGLLTKLEELCLSHNYLSGSIPSSMGNLVDIKYFYLHHNQLSGTLPPMLGDLEKLEYLWASHNSLSGTVPPSFLKLLDSASRIVLHENDINGSMEFLCEETITYPTYIQVDLSEVQCSCCKLGSGTCGNGVQGDGICDNGECCSDSGQCGLDKDHCGGYGL